jgi:hypothetical protein
MLTKALIGSRGGDFFAASPAERQRFAVFLKIVSRTAF